MHRRLQALHEEHGQSLWLDHLDRSLIELDGLRALVEAGVRGVTTNPTIFHQAIAGSDRYDGAIRDLIQADHEIDAAGLAHWLMCKDVQEAADILRPVHEASDGDDGFVSIEVPPYLARQSGATEAAARHLWRQIDRPNVMIKVPGTVEGLRAFERLIGEGISVNVTLLFSLRRYESVIEAYLGGLARNPAPGRVRSVASFFLSRIDVRLAPLLRRIGTPEAAALQGQIAVACARRAYRRFQERFGASAFEPQRQRGARPQRLLWASTGAKDPAERDTRYVESLIGPDTVVTVPLATLDAFLDHGEIGPTLERDRAATDRLLDQLVRTGIDLEQVAAELETDGIDRFAASWDALLQVLDERRSTVARRYAGG